MLEEIFNQGVELANMLNNSAVSEQSLAHTTYNTLKGFRIPEAMKLNVDTILLNFKHAYNVAEDDALQADAEEASFYKDSEQEMLIVGFLTAIIEIADLYSERDTEYIKTLIRSGIDI